MFNLTQLYLFIDTFIAFFFFCLAKYLFVFLCCFQNFLYSSSHFRFQFNNFHLLFALLLLFFSIHSSSKPEDVLVNLNGQWILKCVTIISNKSLSLCFFPSLLFICLSPSFIFGVHCLWDSLHVYSFWNWVCVPLCADWYKKTI